jgi:hypothetical protein
MLFNSVNIRPPIYIRMYRISLALYFIISCYFQQYIFSLAIPTWPFHFLNLLTLWRNSLVEMLNKLKERSVEYYCFVGCDAVYSGRKLNMFLINILPPFSE